jgi:hypothetical protein
MGTCENRFRPLENAWKVIYTFLRQIVRDGDTQNRISLVQCFFRNYREDLMLMNPARPVDILEFRE